MSDQDAFDRILASLHAAILDDTHWPATSALIDEACGMQGNALVVSGGSQDDIRVLFAQAYYRGQYREDWVHEYFKIYHPIDERVPRIRQLPDSRVVHITDLYTAAELQTSPTYNEAMLRFNAQDGLNVRLDGPEGSNIIWAIADPVTPDGWTAPQLALLRGLLPHLRQFFRVRQALAKAGALGASMSELLENPRIGVISLDQRGRIMLANDRARTILRQGDGLSDREGELRADRPADHARLERLLAGALPTADVAAVSGSMALHRSSGLLPFIVHVKPVGAPQTDFGAQRVAGLVLITEPGRRPRIDRGLIASVLGLTPGESQVAAWLAEGRTVRDIALTTGRTESAIHGHLRQIFVKCGISRQVDLVRLVLSITDFA